SGNRRLGLDRNTNLLVTNPALKKLADIIQNEGLNDYPSPFNDELREKIALNLSKYGITADEIIVGNGSDALLDIFFKTFANPGDHVVAPYPTFHMLKFHVLVNMAQIIDVPLLEKGNRWDLEADGFLSSNAKLAVIATPNNPTPNAFDIDVLEKIVKNFKGIVLIDEAYYEYCGITMLDMIKEYPNLVITRTFSKAYGLAGARVGYAISNKKLISRMLRARIPYSVGKISEKLASLALEEKEFLKEVVEKNKECRKYLSDGLGNLGLKVYHSDANFILARLPAKHSSTKLAKDLADKGIFIVDYKNHPSLSNCVRISVGTKEINDEVIESTRKSVGI
ncbi:MAG: histidinol-phosphate transaminase, partial [Thermoplasmata archaeon]